VIKDHHDNRIFGAEWVLLHVSKAPEPFWMPARFN
jgi:hypothetical protein